ncbi:MAG: acetate/propionate family kinase [bacterium]
MPEIKIISINCGSSSIKFSVFKFLRDSSKPEEYEAPELLNIDRILSCKIEEIGTEYGHFYAGDKNSGESANINFNNHEQALNYIIKQSGLFKNAAAGNGNNIDIVAHRYVHGGKYYRKPLIVSDNDIKKLAKLNGLAPLHNPSNLKGLEIMKALLPEAKQVCIFDTAFHGTVPLYAKVYPLPIEYYEKYNIEKYGFHGISYSFIVNILKFYNRKIKKLIVCHLGNGASICAIKNGKSIDTSMGYTPLEGLMMGTRSGSIDPEVPFILKKKLNLTDGDINEILNKKSGLLGISKKTYDFKELIKQKDKYSKLALKMYVYRIVKFIGQYAASLNGLDVLVFTGGIGENSEILRKKVAGSLSFLGVAIDNEKNAAASKYFRTHSPYGRLDAENSVRRVGSGRVEVLAVHTDEELQMAFESASIYE